MIRKHQDDSAYAILPVAVFSKPTSFAGATGALWGRQTPAALDCGQATNMALAPGAAVVLFDPDGNVVAKTGDVKKGAYFYQGVENNAPCNYVDLKKAVEPLMSAKGGLLGGLKVPAQLKPLAGALKAGKLAEVQAALASLPATGEIGDFKAELSKRIEDLRAKKRALFDSLEATDKWGAYKVGVSYLRCFPKAKDISEVRTRVQALTKDPAVKKNLEAQAVFAQIADVCWSPRYKAQALAQARQTLQQFVTKYGDTEHGKLAAGMMGLLP
jgi:hypothetical protein